MNKHKQRTRDEIQGEFKRSWSFDNSPTHQGITLILEVLLDIRDKGKRIEK